MKLKMKTLAAMLALAAAGHASAAIQDGSVNGGSLFLTVWDSVRSVSYTRDLGMLFNQFLPNSVTTSIGDASPLGTATPSPVVTGNKTPDAGLNLSFAGDALFASTFGSSVESNIQWNIVAMDNQSSLQKGVSRLLTTANGTLGTTNAGIGTVNSAGTALVTAVNAAGCSTAASCVVTDPSSAGFGGASSWGDNINNGGLNGSSAGTGYSSVLDFYYIARTAVSGFNATAATQDQFDNASGAAHWKLASDGTATYSLAGAPSEVPVPAAAWLLGSGLMGLLGAARRRKAADQA